MTASLRGLGGGRDAGSYYTTDPNRETRGQDEYYVRDGGGTWWSTGETVVRDGAPIDVNSFRDLCGGFDPRTGDALVRGAGDGHRAGWDLTLSAPKSVSLLWAGGDEAQRKALECAHCRAVDQALRFVVDEGLLVTRTGAQGVRSERPTDLIVGRFDHFTSREGDPQIHTHGTIMNVAGRADGRHGTLETRKLYEYQRVVGAAYRAALSAELHELGFVVHEAGRDQFEIVGFDGRIIEHFSRRSAAIEAAIGERDAATAAQAEIAALATRQSKAHIPDPLELEARWHADLRALGAGDLWQTSQAAGQVRSSNPAPETVQALDPPALAGDSPAARAANDLFRTENVISYKQLLERALIAGSLQGRSIAAVRKDLAQLIDSGALIALPSDDERYFTTEGIARAEARLIRAVDRPRQRTWITKDAVAQALAATPELSAEQTAAVHHTAHPEGVSLIEAGAGTGKTTMARAIVDSAQRSGLHVTGLAPSWAAADELRSSTGIESRSIAAWRVARTGNDRPRLDQRTLILVDEAGTAGTRDLAEILTQAQAAGARVVLMGDRHQLESVPGGAALRAVADALGRSATMTEVRRQQLPWMRAASITMARGDSAAGLRAYADHKRIELVDGPDAARQRAVTAWTELRRDHGKDVLIITKTNEDAKKITALARAQLRTEGRLVGPDVTVGSLDHKRKPTTIALAAGDRIRFRAKLKELGIRNGTRAHILTVSDERLTVRLEDGRVLARPWGDFAERSKNAKLRLPALIHGYSSTTHGVQGRTSEATVLHVGAAGTDARQTYVALTRHRHDARVVAERGRIAAQLARRQADPRAPVSSVAVRQALIAEAGRSSSKRNAIDFVAPGDRARFLGGDISVLQRPTQAATRLPVVGVARAVEQVIATANSTATRMISRSAIRIARVARTLVGIRARGRDSPDLTY